MDAARSTAKTHHSRVRAGMQNMVTGAKNPTSTKRPHHTALPSRKKPIQTHPDRCDPRKRLNRARFYHAELGRFISRDPIGYVDGMSLYRAYFVPTILIHRAEKFVFGVHVNAVRFTVRILLRSEHDATRRMNNVADEPAAKPLAAGILATERGMPANTEFVVPGPVLDSIGRLTKRLTPYAP